jgi:hypothetical protein
VKTEGEEVKAEAGAKRSRSDAGEDAQEPVAKKLKEIEGDGGDGEKKKKKKKDKKAKKEAETA